MMPVIIQFVFEIDCFTIHLLLLHFYILINRFLWQRLHLLLDLLLPFILIYVNMFYKAIGIDASIVSPISRLHSLRWIHRKEVRAISRLLLLLLLLLLHLLPSSFFLFSLLLLNKWEYFRLSQLIPTITSTAIRIGTHLFLFLFQFPTDK